MGCISLAFSTGALSEYPICDTEHEFQHMRRSAYRIYPFGIQAPLLNFFDAHSHHLRNLVFIGTVVHQGDSENQVRTWTRTIAAIESRWRDRKRKPAAERRSQIGLGSISAGQGILDFNPGSRRQVVILCGRRAALSCQMLRIFFLKVK
jgi:hypothetical protein